MNALIYNCQLKMETMVESVMMHASYLLMNKTISAGSTRQLYHLFMKNNESLNEKLKFLEKIYQGHSEFEEAINGIKAFKNFKNIKHPPATLIVAHKKLQKALEAEYANQTKSVTASMKELKLVSMDELEPHGYFSWYHIDEMLRVPGEKHVSVQDILQLLPGEFASEPLMFMLPVSIFKNNVSFNESYHCDAALPSSIENLSFLHTCFELPNLLLLSHSELHIVKMQVQDAFKPFNEAMDRWWQSCTEKNDSCSSAWFFKSEVLPASEAFQNALQQNTILNQHSLAGNDAQRLHFALGEISMSEVWRMLREREMIIGDEVWKEMTTLMEQPRYQQRMPVMFFSAVSGDEEVVKEEGMPFKKKSLVID